MLASQNCSVIINKSNSSTAPGWLLQGIVSHLGELIRHPVPLRRYLLSVECSAFFKEMALAGQAKAIVASSYLVSRALAAEHRLSKALFLLLVERCIERLGSIGEFLPVV
jgi:hypothetical protein